MILGYIHHWTGISYKWICFLLKNNNVEIYKVQLVFSHSPPVSVSHVALCSLTFKSDPSVTWRSWSVSSLPVESVDLFPGQLQWLVHLSAPWWLLSAALFTHWGCMYMKPALWSLQGNELRPHDIKPLSASPSLLALLRHRASKRMCDGQLSSLLHARFELWVIAVALCCRWEAWTIRGQKASGSEAAAHT